MERRTHPRDVKLTVKAFNTVHATWDDRNAHYTATINFFAMKWTLAGNFSRRLKEGSGQEHQLSMLSEANWAIRAGLEALLVPAKLDALQKAFVTASTAQREAEWIQKQEAKALAEAGPEMFDSLRKTQAYLDRRNDALTEDELKANVASVLKKAVYRSDANSKPREAD